MPDAPPTFRPRWHRGPCESRDRHDRQRREEEEWRRWYKLKAWRELRSAQLAREPLCERCLAEDRITAAEVVHHRQPHRGDWALFVAADNLSSVCKDCHDGEIQRGERAGCTDRGWAVEGRVVPPRVIQPLGLSPSLVPLTMVCGAPASGKSALVTHRRQPGDIVIDVEDILDVLSGTTTRTRERRDRWMADALMERNRLLAGLGSGQDAAAAWFIVGAAQPAARELWASQLRPAAVVVCETPAEVCIRRVLADPARAPTSSLMIEGVHTWWERYERAPSDTEYLSEGV